MMKHTAILGLVLLSALGIGAGCSSDKKATNDTGSGGQSSSSGGSSSSSGGQSSSSGSSSSSGGSTSNSTAAEGGSTSVPYCDGTSVEPEHFDGGLVQIGATDPSMSVPLDVGGFFARGSDQGYCFTFADAKTDGSTAFPPCGTGNECFTKDSGLCVTTKLGIASKDIWGSGIGCSLSQASTAGATAGQISIANRTSISVEVYGCATPKKLRLQLNIYPPIYDAEKDQLHSGYYCGDVQLTDPDANGARKGSIEIAKLREDCWTGTGLLLDPSTQTAETVQLQINADGTKKTEYDFCVSKLALE